MDEIEKLIAAHIGDKAPFEFNAASRTKTTVAILSPIGDDGHRVCTMVSFKSLDRHERQSPAFQSFYAKAAATEYLAAWSKAQSGFAAHG